jgi:hypothetical protein
MRVNRTAGFVVVVTALNDCCATGSVNEYEDIYTIYCRHMGFWCLWCVDGIQDCASLSGDEFCEFDVIDEGHLHGLVPLVNARAAMIMLSLAAHKCAL